MGRVTPHQDWRFTCLGGTPIQHFQELRREHHDLGPRFHFAGRDVSRTIERVMRYLGEKFLVSCVLDDVLEPVKHVDREIRQLFLELTALPQRSTGRELRGQRGLGEESLDVPGLEALKLGLFAPGADRSGRNSHSLGEFWHRSAGHIADRRHEKVPTWRNVLAVHWNWSVCRHKERPFGGGYADPN